MKIGIDLRFLSGDSYSQFVIELVKALLYYDKDSQFTIYSNRTYTVFNKPNSSQKVLKIKVGSLKEQTKYLKILNKDNNDLMLFFSYSKPLLYKKNYNTLIPSLKDIYYQNFGNYVDKYKYLLLLESNLKKASKVICFDSNTKDELIERMNLEEKNISLLKPFFNAFDSEISDADIALDIYAKFNIKSRYLIYSGGEGIEKNIERLINVFHRLNKEDIDLDLIILGDDVSKNIHLRNLIIQYNLQHKIHYLGMLSLGEKKLIYAKSQAIIFPSLYEPFPFELSESVFSRKPLLVSNIENNKEILGDNAYYFSPISSNSIVEVIKEFLSDKEKKIPDLQNINSTYNIDNSSGAFLEIINKI